jgi:hypothetical protein
MYEATQAGLLNTGDRFYFPKDAKKTVWEVITTNEPMEVKSVGKPIKKIKSETPVVFLRCKI